MDRFAGRSLLTGGIDLRMQALTIPLATGSYFAASRGLIEQPAYLRLPAHGRLVLLTLERMLPACAAATLHEPLVTAHAGIEVEDLRAALADLEAVGFLIRQGDWWVMPYLLDPVNGKARGRVIYEVRQLPEDVQAILRERHRWVMGRQAKAAKKPDPSRVRVTGAGARNPARTQPTNQPTRRTIKPSGGWQSDRARARDPEPLGAPIARASTSPDDPRDAAEADPPGADANGDGERYSVLEHVRSLGVRPVREVRADAWKAGEVEDRDGELDAIRREVLAQTWADKQRETDEP